MNNMLGTSNDSLNHEIKIMVFELRFKKVCCYFEKKMKNNMEMECEFE